jgi:tetratricopeptide (TPR) repeat protein
LVPVIGLVQVGSQGMADRYTYLPTLGLLIGLVGALNELLGRARKELGLLAAAGSVILAGCLVITSVQLSYWRDSVSLFTRTVAVTRDNPIGNLDLAIALEKAGDKDKALDHYREAARLAPDAVLVQINYANLLEDLGKTTEADKHYLEALRYGPDNSLAHCLYAMHLSRAGKYDEANEQFAIAIKLSPRDPSNYYLAAKAQMRQGKSADAAANFHHALQLDPDNAHALSYLARLLATDNDAAVRNGKEAVELAERANQLTGGQQAFVLDTLAAAYAETGRFDDAVKTVQKAIDSEKAAGDADSVAPLQERLKLYQSSQPCRESSTNLQSEPVPPVIQSINK